MQLKDVTVEVRDINLTRMGMIRPEDLTLTAEILYNNVGSWTLNLPGEHPLAATLRTPGSGIIVQGPDDVLFSGPTTQITSSASQDDPFGTIVFQGSTDDVLLADSLAFPTPTVADATKQTTANDTRTGPAETLMHAYVNANVGPGAPAARRGKLAKKLTMGTNSARGGSLKKAPRFDTLGVLLTEIGLVAKLGFRVVQRGAVLVFETYAITDRSKEIRLDLWNNTLTSREVALTGPTATEVIVAGQGEGINRAFYVGTNTAAQQGEADWGRRIERWIDQRQSDDPADYKQAADELLADEGASNASVALTPTDDSTMRFGHDWGLGDLIAAVADDGEYAAPVSKVVMTVASDGTRIGAVLGDPDRLSIGYPLTTTVSATAKRLAALERSS